MLSYALYAQYALGLEPCPLCIFQRVTIFALAVLFLAAALQNPRGGGRYVYAALVGLAALAHLLQIVSCAEGGPAAGDHDEDGVAMFVENVLL